MAGGAEKISITITPSLKKFIQARVARGEFESTSELIREALRHWRRQESEHEARIEAVRSRIAASIVDRRRPVSTEKARAAITRHVSARRKSAQ